MAWDLPRQLRPRPSPMGYTHRYMIWTALRYILHVEKVRVSESALNIFAASNAFVTLYVQLIAV